MDFNIKIDGFDFHDLITELDKLDKDFAKKKRKFLMQQGEKVIATTKKLTPVDTGELRQTFRKKMSNPSTVVIYNNTPYASHIEYGHRTRGKKGFVRGRYMLKRSMNYRNAKIKGDLEEFIKKEIKK
ncbi:MAG: HK97 gp10 family phage protein [Fusobacteriaceae bacterium]